MPLTHRHSEKPGPTTTSPTANLSSLSSSHVDDIFGSANNTSRPPTAATASKHAFDDLDDDFEGLEDAKEGSADDDFANISRSGLDDFNSVFDSSPPPSQPKSGSAHTAGGAVFGTESSFDFGSLSGTSAAGSTAGPTTAAASASSPAAPAAAAAGAKPSDAHDWDALFAGLESATTPTTASPVGGGSAGAGTTTTTTATAATGAGDADGGRPPAPGRALTEEGEHDDPILKNLTGMGYSRKEALAALEKYDYNLERVSLPAAAAAAAHDDDDDDARTVRVGGLGKGKGMGKWGLGMRA